jgi:hypothetical protein
VQETKSSPDAKPGEAGRQIQAELFADRAERFKLIRDATARLWGLSRVTSKNMAELLIAVENTLKRDGSCRVEVLASKVKRGRRQTQKLIRLTEHAGLLTVERGREGERRQSLYQIQWDEIRRVAVSGKNCRAQIGAGLRGIFCRAESAAQTSAEAETPDAVARQKNAPPPNLLLPSASAYLPSLYVARRTQEGREELFEREKASNAVGRRRPAPIGEAIQSADLKRRALALGINGAAAMLGVAQRRGVTLSRIDRLLLHAEADPGKFGPGNIYARVINDRPEMAIDEGWFSPQEGWTRAEDRKARDRRAQKERDATAEERRRAESELEKMNQLETRFGEVLDAMTDGQVHELLDRCEGVNEFHRRRNWHKPGIAREMLLQRIAADNSVALAAANRK